MVARIVYMKAEEKKAIITITKGNVAMSSTNLQPVLMFYLHTGSNENHFSLPVHYSNHSS